MKRELKQFIALTMAVILGFSCVMFATEQENELCFESEFIHSEAVKSDFNAPSVEELLLEELELKTETHEYELSGVSDSASVYIYCGN